MGQEARITRDGVYVEKPASQHKGNYVKQTQFSPFLGTKRRSSKKTNPNEPNFQGIPGSLEGLAN